ncbi:MAG: HDOD domain-containing protein [Bryobacterales bacterium]|nr:HDOD domain-containing protein [Bryobacterales bacterium]
MRERFDTAGRAPMHIHAKAIGQLGKLPPFSPVLTKLMASLADEDVSFNEIATTIEKDTVLAGNVLRLVNSALYGLRGTVNSVRHAVSLLGLSRIRNTAMSISLGQLYTKLNAHPKWSHRQFNLRSISEATMADQLAQHIDADYPEGGFAAGLLHHLGLLLAAIAIQAEFDQVRLGYTDGTRSLEECELMYWGFAHTELTGSILREWNLPTPIQTAVRTDLPIPSDVTPVPLSRLVLASARLANRLSIPIQPWMRPAEGLPTEIFEEMGLQEKAPMILERFHAEFEAIRGFFH